ncbi:ribosomal-protein-alanine N-acetyltransferase [Marinomonas spartinae]|uniref:Ribosomal-protein-alanine N-acetyltransferase n=1 Tax=Marinomonas spartinae TaxID=1792290 RepID=A0A1A8TD81_9GAMM|nr:GNAT family N-acetyltransferase [Marinomonas spartinae]SBS30753.1 ribosomal-protein-alanine N-acetyltransferase [Marinomonas spartinae]
MGDMDFQLLALRKENKADMLFIKNLYYMSREAEMATVPWSLSDKKLFLKKQFTLQKKHFDKVYPQAIKQLILYQGQPIGRLYTVVNEKSKDWHLIDVTLLPERCGLGVGRYLITQLINKVSSKKAKLTLYVHSRNPAYQLYVDMGFEKIGDKEGYYHMQNNCLESRALPYLIC